MTPEEKVKAYDKVIEILRKCETDKYGCIIGIKPSDKFPELKESEDEKIRKEIIATIHLYYGEPLEDEAQEMIAWLEKQGEHANFRNKIQIGDKVTRNEAGILVNISQLNMVAKERKKQEEPQVYETKDGKVITYSETDGYKVEQKSTDNEMKGILRTEYEKGRADAIAEMQNHAWSEEDAAMLDSAIAFVEHSAFTTVGKGKGGVVAWLKSLKDRYAWKPSDEQMDALLVKIPIENSYNKVDNILKSLYSDLKRLK